MLFLKDILGQIILCCAGCPVHYRIFSSITGHPPDARSCPIIWVVTTQISNCQMSLKGWKEDCATFWPPPPNTQSKNFRTKAIKHIICTDCHLNNQHGKPTKKECLFGIKICKWALSDVVYAVVQIGPLNTWTAPVQCGGKLGMCSLAHVFSC